MCCYRQSDEELLIRQQEWRQQKAVEDLAAAIENAEVPEVKSVVSSDKKQDGTPGIRGTRTNG